MIHITDLCHYFLLVFIIFIFHLSSVMGFKVLSRGFPGCSPMKRLNLPSLRHRNVLQIPHLGLAVIPIITPLDWLEEKIQLTLIHLKGKLWSGYCGRFHVEGLSSPV